jgi:hypothetical protein
MLCTCMQACMYVWRGAFLSGVDGSLLASQAAGPLIIVEMTGIRHVAAAA